MKQEKKEPLDIIQDIMELMFWGKPVKQKDDNNERL